MKPVYRIVMLLFISLGGGGCAVTHDMWEQAKSRTLEYPSVAGCLTRAGEDHPHAIVVEYPVIGAGWFRDRPFYVLIPLNPDGSVPSPYAYHGPAHRIMRIERELPPAQVDQVRTAIFSPADFQAAKQAMRSEDFRPLNRLPGGVSTVESMKMSSAQNLSVLAYWPAGTAPEARYNWNQIPPDATFMVLPSRQPRPESDRSANIALATALTPLTVVADVVLDPIGMVAWWIHGDKP